jgi:O-antigen/teichoic acid export membrane protein
VNIANSSIKVFAANAVSAGLVFIGTTYFARELGPKLVGIFFLFQALLSVLSILTDIGLRGAIEKRLSEGEAQAAVLGTGITLKLLSLAIIGPILWIASDAVDNFLGQPLTALLFIAILVHEIGELMIFVLRGELRVGETAVLRLTYQAVWFSCSVLLYLRGHGVKSLIYGIIVGYSIVIFWGMYKQKTGIRSPRVVHAKSLLEFAKYDVAARAGGYFYSWVDVLIIGFFLTQSAVGAYEVAWRVTLLVTLFSNALARSSLPVISQWQAKGDLDQLNEALPSLFTASLLLVMPALAGAVIISEPLLRELFGIEYIVASLVLILLLIEKLFQAVRVIMGTALRAINQPQLEARATIIAVIVNLGLNIILVPAFHIEGAAFATLVSFGLHTVLDGYYLNKFVNISFQNISLLWCSFSAILMVFIVFLIKSAIVIDSIPKVLLVTGIGGIVYTSIILVYSPLREQLFNLWAING